jgi:hypothetical protein
MESPMDATLLGNRGAACTGGTAVSKQIKTTTMDARFMIPPRWISII